MAPRPAPAAAGASSAPAPALPPRTATQDLPDKLPPYQESCLRIYDAVDYAENAFDVPVVAYDGADDPQKQASRNIEEKLKPLGIPMTLLVAPGLKHEFPAEWQKKAEAEYEKYTTRGGRSSRSRSISSPTP